MAMITGGYSQLTDRNLRKVFWHDYLMHSPEYTKVAKMDPMDGSYDKEGEAAGLTQLEEMHEHQTIPFEDFKQGNTKQMEPKNFGLGVQISRNMMDDDLTKIMTKAIKELSKAATYSEEVEFWDLLNNGFVTTYHTGADGLALFSGSHSTIKSGDTIDNDGTDASLSVTSLQEMYTYFDTLKDESGRPMQAKAGLLIIPPQLRYKAEKLMLSEYDPENANMQYNTVKGLEFMVGHHLTSTTAFFVIDKELHDLRFRWRKKIQFDSTGDFHTKGMLYSAVGRFMADFVHYRGAFGNSGA